jgi:hypothetical protein
VRNGDDHWQQRLDSGPDAMVERRASVPTRPSSAASSSAMACPIASAARARLAGTGRPAAPADATASKQVAGVGVAQCGEALVRGKVRGLARQWGTDALAGHRWRRRR